MIGMIGCISSSGIKCAPKCSAAVVVELVLDEVVDEVVVVEEVVVPAIVVVDEEVVLEEVEGYVVELRDTWKQAMIQMNNR